MLVDVGMMRNLTVIGHRLQKDDLALKGTIFLRSPTSKLATISGCWLDFTYGFRLMTPPAWEKFVLAGREVVVCDANLAPIAWKVWNLAQVGQL